MTKEQKNKCQAIIHSAAAAASVPGALGAAFPLADNLIIVPIQITMIITLGKVFKIKLDRSQARLLLYPFLAVYAGRWISQAIPLIGNLSNAITAAGLTEYIGWKIAKDFERKSYRPKI